MIRTIVHAGFHKTGTTSLQAALSESRTWLAEHGVAYPSAGTGGFPAHHALASLCADDRESGGPNDLFVPERQVFGRRGGWRPATEEHLPRDTTVFSSEIICTFDGTEFARLVDELGSVDQVVLYRRDGIGFLWSSWATKVRWGTQLSFRDFLVDSLSLRPATPIAGAFGCVEVLSGAVGERAVDVRSLAVATAHPGGLVGDFYHHVLGVPAPTQVTAAEHNVTPTPEHVELARGLAVLSGGRGPSLAALRARASRDQQVRKIVLSLGEVVRAVMRSVTIHDLDAGRLIGDDGRVRGPRTAGARLLGDWSFPRHQPLPCADTVELVDVLGGRPETRELMALMHREA